MEMFSTQDWLINSQVHHFTVGFSIKKEALLKTEMGKMIEIVLVGFSYFESLSGLHDTKLTLLVFFGSLPLG